MSLWIRLFITFLLCLLVTLIFLGVYLTINLRMFQVEETTGWLVTQAKALTPKVRQYLTTATPRFTLPNQLETELVGYTGVMGVTILDSSGRIIWSSITNDTANWIDKPEVVAALIRRENGSDTRPFLERSNLFIAIPVVSSGRIIGAIDLNYSLSRVEEQTRQSIRFIFATFMIAMLVGALFIYNVTQFQIQPLRNLIFVASAISAGEYGKQFEVHGNDEVGQLARALQIMVGKLKSALSIAANERSTLQGVFEGVVDGLILVDPDGRVQLANLSSLTMFGLDDTSIEGKLVEETDFPPELIEFLKTTKTNAETEVKFNRPQRRFVRVRATPVNQDDSMLGILAICEDVTRIRLLEANEREFTQYISHELKTPLASLSASVETLQTSAKNDPKAQAHFLSNINEDIVRLTKLVNSLLTYQRIQAAPDEMNRFGAVELILEIHSRFLAYASKKGILLDLDVPDDEYDVIASRDRIIQVLINLTDNALRFTKKGGTVCLQLKAETKRVKISIIDTGVGIPKDFVDRLGERFIKIPRKDHQFDTNVGLGVAICKEILKRHGSTLEVESEENRGTTFSFHLKRAN
jgi:PAS domain S-box-containing protein